MPLPIIDIADIIIDTLIITPAPLMPLITTLLMPDFTPRAAEPPPRRHLSHYFQTAISPLADTPLTLMPDIDVQPIIFTPFRHTFRCHFTPAFAMPFYAIIDIERHLLSLLIRLMPLFSTYFHYADIIFAAIAAFLRWPLRFTPRC